MYGSRTYTGRGGVRREWEPWKIFFLLPGFSTRCCRANEPRRVEKNLIYIISVYFDSIFFCFCRSIHISNRAEILFWARIKVAMIPRVLIIDSSLVATGPALRHSSASVTHSTAHFIIAIIGLSQNSLQTSAKILSSRESTHFAFSICLLSLSMKKISSCVNRKVFCWYFSLLFFFGLRLVNILFFRLSQSSVCGNDARLSAEGYHCGF